MTTPRYKLQQICEDTLCRLDIHNRKQAKQWLLKNHPDKNPNVNMNDVKQVTKCFRNNLFCGDNNDGIRKSRRTETKSKNTQNHKKTQKKFTLLRQIANWANITNEERIDSKKFNKEEVLKNMEIVSPKAYDLVKNIQLLDENDMKVYGKKFKHFIFSDVKSMGYGAKILSSVLTANGYHNLVGMSDSNGRKTSNITLQTTTKKHEYNSFAFLTSTALYGKPPTQKMKHAILERFNKRPNNIYGKDIRIIILDSGFKEGVDLFDVKYVHLYEPPLTYADEKQAIGRATRLCGQKGLPFQEGKGWPLYVYTYNTIFDDEFKEIYKHKLNNNESIHGLILDYSDLDKTSIELGNQLYEIAPYLSVDYSLTKEIHFPNNTQKDILFEDVIESVPKLMNGGTRGIKKNYYRKLFNINCKGKCGKRSTKDIPATTKFLEKIFKRMYGDNKRRMKQFRRATRQDLKRQFLCYELQKRPSYCKAVKEAWRERYAIVPFIQKQPSKSKNSILENNELIEYQFVDDIYDIQPYFEYDGKYITKYKTYQPEKMKKLNFKEMRDYIKTNFHQYKWSNPGVTNKCIEEDTNKNNTKREKTEQEKQMDQIITYTPTQDFVRHYFTPQSPYKGLLLWHSVGTGKTCSAVATASTTFERQGYSILWVTRNTLKKDIWKNIFDKICHDIIAEEIRNGVLLPQNLNKRKRELYKHWIEPISYKQFTNLLTGKNEYFKQLQERNGKTDILKKTLIIIDEAHKLYSTDLKAQEKPDIDILRQYIYKSYRVSGENSVKLLLMTATPFTNSPMELFKLVNLMKENEKERITTSLSAFKSNYMTNENEFTKEGLHKIANKLSGYISYLDRSKDISQFANVVKIRVTSLFSSLTKEERHTLFCKEQEKDSEEIKKELNHMTNEIKQLREIRKEKTKKIQELKKNTTQKRKVCRSKFKGKVNIREKENCIADVNQEFNEKKDNIEKDYEDIQERIKELQEQKLNAQKRKTTKNENKKALKQKRKTIKQKRNQENIFRDKFLDMKIKELQNRYSNLYPENKHC